MITIGIPFFNDESYLDMAIRSVINQTYQDWVLLLVDDGSSDGSLGIAKKYAEKDSRISVISDGENKKLPYRLNQIAQLTKTPYLARMDADDIMHPERIEKQLGILESNQEIDVLGTNAYSIDSNNEIRGVRYEIHAPFELEKCSGFIHPSITGRTSWFQNNPYDEGLERAQDSELWHRTRLFSRFYRYNEPLLYYREVSNGYYKKYNIQLKTYSHSIMKDPTLNLFKKFLLTATKMMVYYFMFSIGKEEKLIARRSFPLDENQFELSSVYLKSALS